MALKEIVPIFLLLCRCLGERAPETWGSALAPAGDGRWKALTQISALHFVTPALHHSLRRLNLLHVAPPDMQAFLEQAYALNSARNHQLRAQACDVIAALNGSDIEPLLLKGAANLFEYPAAEIGRWMMVDLDILVPPGDFDRSIRVMEARGYKTVRPPKQKRAYHYSPILRPGDVATIEIHRDLGPQWHILSADSAYREAVPFRLEGLRAAAPSPTHRVVHNVFHAQIQNRSHEFGSIPLKQLYDLATIYEKHRASIDWTEVRQLMGREHAVALDSYLFLADKLLDLDDLAPVRQKRRARLHYRRCLLQMRVRPAMAMVAVWAAATRGLGRSDVAYQSGTESSLFAARLQHWWRLLRRRRLGLAKRIFLICSEGMRYK